MNWTKQHPTESGFYWYRSSSRVPRGIVSVSTNGICFKICVGFPGIERRFFDSEIDGEFWPVKLEPPPS